MTEEQTPTDDVLDAVSYQPALPELELPDYHGRKPVGMRTGLAGAGTRVTRPHTIGDKIVLVIEARVKKASHEDTDDGLIYAESLKVLDLFELTGDQGARLISTVRSLYRTADDAVKGRRPVPGLGEVGYTDASGVVLTPAEVAELRGDPVRAMLSLDLQPAVIVYEDGSRDLWPDDYPKDAPRPAIGERYLTDGGEVLVTRLLHHETGEEIFEAEPMPADFVERMTHPVTGAVLTTTEEFEEADRAREELADLADGIEELADRIVEANVISIHRKTGELPDLPDAYAGDLGDSVVEEWETPDPRSVDEIAADLATAQIEDLLPSLVDFAFVDRPIDELAVNLPSVDELSFAIRILRAEQQGRGRNLKPRAGALSWIEKRIVELGGNPEEVGTRGA